nr:adenylate kinase [Actinomycetota bacterium]
YAQSTAPLVGYYDKTGILVKIQASGPVEEVTRRAVDALKAHRSPTAGGAGR